MTRARFERLVADALTTVPQQFRDAMQNLAIVVEDEPDDELLDEMNAGPDDTLFGLYTGIPLTERQWAQGNTLPDRILIFQGPHEREAEDEDDLVVSIGETLIHEIGHYFGMSEEEIDRKLAELRVVEGWLTMNLGMLSMQMKTLEMQRAALSALKPREEKK